MALVTNQMQGSYVIPSRHSLWSQRIAPKHFASLRMVGRTDACLLLKKNIRSSVGTPCVRVSKFKLRISAFKGRNDASEGISNGSKVQKNSVKLKDVADSLTETPKENDMPVYYTSDTNNGKDTFPSFYRLFKNWLTLLCTQPSSQEVDGILGDFSLKESSDIHREAPNKGRVDILKSVWSRFLGLNAMIKIPLMMFVPSYLAVNVLYGAEVSKELTPLWVMGPFIIALYIKMFQWLCALYIFCFKQATKIVKNLPTYCKFAYIYIVNGKLKEDAHACFWQPIMNVKNADYKGLSRRKLKVLGDWLTEKYLDYVESIWPFYCRTIRFLKRANLI